jgi:hypothetical protein
VDVVLGRGLGGTKVALTVSGLDAGRLHERLLPARAQGAPETPLSPGGAPFPSNWLQPPTPSTRGALAHLGLGPEVGGASLTQGICSPA